MYRYTYIHLYIYMHALFVTTHDCIVPSLGYFKGTNYEIH